MSDIPSTVAAVHPDGTVSLGSDARLYVQFFAYSEHQPYRSQLEGRPIYEKRDYVRIIQPGERDKVEREATDYDKERFPRQWASYVAKQEQTADGTPIEILYPNDPHICDQMRGLSVHTVEQLAGITEAGISRLGLGGREKVQRAKAFLEAAGNMRGAHGMQRELDAARDEIATLKAAIDQLRAELAERPRRRKASSEEEV